MRRVLLQGLPDPDTVVKVKGDLFLWYLDLHTQLYLSVRRVSTPEIQVPAWAACWACHKHASYCQQTGHEGLNRISHIFYIFFIYFTYFHWKIAFKYFTYLIQALHISHIIHIRKIQLHIFHIFHIRKYLLHLQHITCILLTYYLLFLHWIYLFLTYF